MKTIMSKLIGLYLNILALVVPRIAGKKGFELFCYPFRGKMSDRHKEFLMSAQQFRIQSGEKPVQCYQWGNGSKNVLFLHGWQSHTFRWKAYVEALDKNEYTVYSIDAPSHGLSPGNFMTVPLYSEAIEKVIEQIGKVHSVICHSLGGFTAIYTFNKKPQLAPEKMIALAPPGEAAEFFKFYSLQLGLSARVLQLTIDHFKEAVGQTPEYFSASAFAASLKMPGLLIHDEEDDETSVENSKAIHRAWVNSKLIVTKGKGHNLKSPEVVREVVDFINKGNNLKTASSPDYALNLS
jgi:pimeloyl-ACP methyl ester carboxylesterase